MKSSSQHFARVLPAIVGLSCLFAVYFIVFLEGRGVNVLIFPLSGISLGLCCGMLCGGLLFSPRILQSFGLLCMLACTVASVLLWAFAMSSGKIAACYGACFFSGMLLPPLLIRFFAVATSPGLQLGAALAGGDFFWLFLYVLPDAPDVYSMERILLVLQAAGGALAALSLWQGTREHAPSAQPLPKGNTEKAHKEATLKSHAFETLLYLTFIALLFFAFNAFMDMLFYRLHAATFLIPPWVHLYIWVSYPLAGLLIDLRGTDLRFFLVCLGLVLIAPGITALSEGTLLHWIIYMLILTGRDFALLYLLLVFARIQSRFSRPGLVLVLPCLCLFSTLLAVYLFVTRFPGTVHVILWGFVLTASFSYISSRIQYALTLSSILVPMQFPVPNQEKKPERPCEAEAMASFSKKYGISVREQDVLRLILEGKDTNSIGEALYISENTIKSHVRQLLRKTETKNRSILVALFFNEVKNPFSKAQD